MLQSRKLVTWPNVWQLFVRAIDWRSRTSSALCRGRHMDSVARDGGGRGPIVSPSVLAPGADDNASGTAAVFTLARRDARLDSE